jgi:hypothetical protein
MPNEDYTFTFKLAYTCEKKDYIVNEYMTITDFIKDMKVKVRKDFHFNSNVYIEFVECGQYNNVNGHEPELAPALENSSQKLYQVFDKDCAFYIRKKILSL